MAFRKTTVFLAVGMLSLGAADQVFAEEKEGGALEQIKDRVTLSGTIEVDALWGKDFAGEKTSDLALSTATLGVEGKLAPWAVATLAFDWDDEEDKVTVDEAYITLGKTDDIPVYLSTGRLYLPFGNFTTNMIQDPFTLTLGEIQASSVVGGVSLKGFSAGLFAYKGMNEAGSDDDIKGYGAMAGYEFSGDAVSFSAGAAVVGNIADSGGIDDAFGEAGLDEIRDFVPGLAAYAGATFGPVSIFAEYVGALDSFAAEELAFGEVGAQPAAVTVEAGYTTELAGKETVFAAGYQWSIEALALGLPEQRLLVSAGVSLVEGLRVIGEYFHDRDYSVADGGSDETADGVTLRLAYEF
jgi:hypothetical protein